MKAGSAVLALISIGSALCLVACGGSNASASFPPRTFAAQPSISSLSPSGATVGGGQLNLQVFGSGFINGSVVMWNGSARDTRFISASQLSATILATDIANIGNAVVLVWNSPPNGARSDGVFFAIHPVQPVIVTLSPANAIVGTTGFTLTVNGTGFDPSATVIWNFNALPTTFVSSTQLTADVPAGDLTSTGTATIFVTSGSDSNWVSYTVMNPQPAIASLVPADVSAGSAPFVLNVNGNGFVPGAIVLWNGSGLLTSYGTASQITAAVPAGDVAAQGSAQVSVVNPSPAVGSSNPTTFTIDPPTDNPVPALTSLSDTSVPANWPGFPLTIDGDSFVAATIAQWNSADRPTSPVSSTQLKAAIPLTDLQSPGTAQVTAFNPAPGGGTSNPLTFTIQPVAAGAVGVIERSSISTGLNESDGNSSSPSIDGDGRFVTFLSQADNLVAGDAGTGVFLRDTCIGAAGCVPSVVRIPNSIPDAASISANGRYVAFTEPGDVLYVRDTCFGASQPCTPASSLVVDPGSFNSAYSPALSASGRYIAYSLAAFVNCDYYGNCSVDAEAYSYDSCAGATGPCTSSTTTISLANDGSLPNDTTTDLVVALSADGRFGAFTSTASNLVSGGTNGTLEVYLRDTCIGAGGPCTPGTQLVSVANDGSQLNGANNEVSISGTGRFVTFSTNNNNATPGDTNNNIFVRDTCFGATVPCMPSTTQVSLANDGSQPNSSSSGASISPDGRFVVFSSDATNLVASDNSPFTKIFLRDTCFGATGCTPSTTLISISLGGTTADNNSTSPMLSGDAHYVVFTSSAGNLGPGDSNQAPDIFVARTNVQ